MGIRGCLAIAVATLCLSCSKGDEGGLGTFTIEGKLSIPSEQRAARQHQLFHRRLYQLLVPSAWAFSAVAMAGAHVNVCTIQDNRLQPLPAHPSVLAGPSGKFVISVNARDVPPSGQLFVCASEPSSGAYTLQAAIPQDLLPGNPTEVSTITVNPNVSQTLVVRYACGQNILLFNKKKCLTVDRAQLLRIKNVFDILLNKSTSSSADLKNLGSVVRALGDDSYTATYLEKWLAEVPDVEYETFVSDAQNFKVPIVPPPSASSSPDAGTTQGGATIKSAECRISGGVDPKTVTIDVRGTVGGGGIDVMTVFLRIDGGDLTGPQQLNCDTWSLTGGDATCTKEGASSEQVSFSATHSYPTFTPTESVVVELKAFAAGSPTVLASDEKTVSCQ